MRKKIDNRQLIMDNSELPKGWEMKKLGDVFDIKSSKRVHKKDWKNEGIPFYRAREVVKLSEFGKVNNELFISPELYLEYTKDKGSPKENDIIVSAVGTLGKCYLVKKDDKFYIKDASVLWFEKTSNIESRYVDYAFKSDFILKQVFYKSMGATVGTLTISRAKNIKIPIPPLPEQKRIVSILDRTFEAIDKAKANAEQNLKNAKELFESYLQGVFENKGNDWKDKKLGEVCVINPKKSEVNNLPKNLLVSFLPMKDLGIAQNQINPIITKQLSDVKGSYTYFRNEDVLLAKVTPCFENGKLGIAKNLKNEIGFGSSEYIVFRPKNKILSEYIFYILSNPKFRNKGKELMFGAVGLKRLSKDYVQNFVAPLPSLDEQQQIVQKLDSLSTETKKLESIYQQKISNLEELKKSILQKAFAGELI